MTDKYKITRPRTDTLFIEDDAGSVICQFPFYSLDREHFSGLILHLLNTNAQVMKALDDCGHELKNNEIIGIYKHRENERKMTYHPKITFKTSLDFEDINKLTALQKSVCNPLSISILDCVEDISHTTEDFYAEVWISLPELCRP